MITDTPTIPLHNIYEAAYLDFKGISVQMLKEGRRIIFLLPDTPGTYQIIAEFNRNPTLKIQDYLTHLRKLRAMMISLRD